MNPTSALRLAHSLTAAAALALVAPAQSVLVVQADGGGDYATLQAAIDAAVTGDTILARPGQYAGFTIDGFLTGPRDVTLVGDGPGVEVVGSAIVRNVAAPSHVTLKGLQLMPESGTPLELWDSTGLIRIEDCEVEPMLPPPLGDLIPASGQYGARIESCLSVTVSDCRIRCGQYSGNFGGHGLYSVASKVYLFDSDVSGSLVYHGVDVGAGLRAVDSYVRASGGSFVGANGVNGSEVDVGLWITCTDGADGGPGVHFEGTTLLKHALVTHDTGIHGGAGGWPGGEACSAGDPGPDSILVGVKHSELDLAWPARSYDITSPVRAGEVGTFTFEGTPGELCWAMFALAPATVTAPGFTGVLALDDPLKPIYLGAVPASGVLQKPIVVSLPPGMDYALAYEQGLFFSLEDGFVTSTPRSGWVLASHL